MAVNRTWNKNKKTCWLWTTIPWYHIIINNSNKKPKSLWKGIFMNSISRKIFYNLFKGNLIIIIVNFTNKFLKFNFYILLTYICSFLVVIELFRIIIHFIFCFKVTRMPFFWYFLVFMHHKGYSLEIYGVSERSSSIWERLIDSGLRLVAY